LKQGRRRGTVGDLQGMPIGDPALNARGDVQLQEVCATGSPERRCGPEQDGAELSMG